jgi:glycosyltransferase involved in cell wall biosynthesis
LFADHFHAISQAVKDAAIKRLLIPRRRISVIHRGRDAVRLGRRSEARRREVRQRLGLADDSFVFLAAARADVPKGVAYAVSAFQSVAMAMPNAVLILAGRDGNASKSVDAALHALPATARVCRLGHRDDVPDLMAAADVYLLPSLWEGLGCVVLEAMALELPVIASDLPAVREVMGHDGAVFVPAADSRALATAMIELAASTEQRRQLAIRGRATFEASFTLEKSARGMLDLFEQTAQ